MLTVRLPQHENGLSLTGTTGKDGTLTFGKESGQTMKYNTVYCLTETVAPEGYVLDAVPHYFAVAKQQEDGKCPTFPNGVTVWYQSADYTYQAYNHKGEATVAQGIFGCGRQSSGKNRRRLPFRNLCRSKSHRQSAANGDHHIREQHAHAGERDSEVYKPDPWENVLHLRVG